MKLNEYLVHPGISSSDLRAFMQCPLKYANRGTKHRTPAMLVGSAVHALVEGIFDDEFAVIPDGIDRRTKEGKAAYAVFQDASWGKDILTAEQFVDVRGMADSVLDLIDGRFGFSDRENEPSLFWTDEESGLLCKARPDIVIEGIEPSIIEIKTTTDASAEAWYWKVKAMRYGIQAIHHLAGMVAARGENPSYAWLVVENTPPYAAVIHWLRPGVMFAQETVMRVNALNAMRQCIDEKHYPSYSEDEITW